MSLNSQNFSFFSLNFATGLRVSELSGIRWVDVGFENRELRVTRSI